MSNLGYCLYGFFQTTDHRPQTTDLNILGIDNTHKLEAISLEDLVAVVSQVPLKEFGEESLKENIQDIKWLEKNIRAYDEITRKLFSQTTFIPVRFGTIYLTKERVKESIKDSKEQIIKLIKYLKGKVELGIKFFFNRKKLEEGLLTTDLEVNDLYKKIQSETPGKAHFLKKKLETLLNKKIELWSDEIIKIIFESLKVFSINIQLLSLRPKDGDLQMFFNVACLITNEKFDSFKEQINNLTNLEKLKSVNYEITGPWPPYSFANLDEEKETTNV